MVTAKPHPLDFAALDKGSVVRAVEIEAAFQIKREDPQYGLAQKRIADMIEAQRPGLLCRRSGYDVRIMTDLEAEEVTWRREQNHVRGMIRNNCRRELIDREKFTDEQLRIAETRDRHIAAAILASRKEIEQAERDARLLKAVDDGVAGQGKGPLGRQ